MVVQRRESAIGTTTVAVAAAAPQAERGRNQVQRVDLVTGFHAARLKRIVAFAASVVIQVGHVGRNLGSTLRTARIAAGRVVIVVVVACAYGQFAFLHGAEQSASGAAVADVAAYGHRVAFESATLSHDVQDTTHALGIVFRAGVGDDLNVLDGVGGHALQHFGGVVAHHVVGLAVHVDLEGAASVHFDVVFSVHGHQGYLAKHFEQRVGLRVGVVLHVVFYFVNVGLHQRLLCHYFHLAQFVRGIGDVEGSEVYQLLAGLDGKVFHNGVASHRSDGQHKVSCAGHLLAEFAFHVRHQHFHRLLRFLFLSHSDGGIRLAFVGERIEQHSLDLESSRRALCHCYGRYSDEHPQQYTALHHAFSAFHTLFK